MNHSDTLPHSREFSAAPTNLDAAWLASRRVEELTEIVERGIQGGDLFYAANREVQRRAALAADAAERAREAELRRNRIMALTAILVLIGCAYLVSTMVLGG